MAKIKFGALATDARGKIGGVVYSKNQYGGYIREKVSPVQPQSARQTLVRERLTTVSKRYSTVITPDQRTAWAAFGKLNPGVDSFGNPQPMTGIGAFTRLNAILLNLGQAIIDTPPANLAIRGLLSGVALATIESRSETITAGSLTLNVVSLTVATNTIEVGDYIALSGLAVMTFLNGTKQKVTVVSPTLIQFDYVHADVVGPETAGTATATDTLRITFTDTPLVTPVRLYLHASAGLNAGRTFFRPNMRWFSASAAAQASTYNASADYVQKFGAMILGSAIGITIAAADGATGAVTPGIFSRALVTT